MPTVRRREFLMISYETMNRVAACAKLIANVFAVFGEHRVDLAEWEQCVYWSLKYEYEFSGKGLTEGIASEYIRAVREYTAAAMGECFYDDN